MSDDLLNGRPTKRPKLAESTQEVLVATDANNIDKSSRKDAFQITQDQKEVDVGISAFVATDTEGFKALLKVRYTDFLVHEILPTGKVVHLTSTTVPEQFGIRGNVNKKAAQDGLPGRSTTDASETNPTDREVPEATVKGGILQTTTNGQDSRSPIPNRISEEDRQQLVQYLNPQTVSELLRLYQSTIKHPQKRAKDHPTVRTDFTTDRSLRTEIHGFIRRVFSSQIESRTGKDGILVLTAAAASNRNHRPGNDDDKPSFRPGKLGWADKGGEHLHFTLYKENKDTMEVISHLVRQMKINAKAFQFAGTKDRRAVTAQRVSAFRVDMERLASQNRFLKASCVGDFEYQQYGLELGDLAGNEFTITLRDCQFPGTMDLEVDGMIQQARNIGKKAMGGLHEGGYLNYFGLQRFGTFATRTDMVGVQILKGDLKAAVEAILDYEPTALPDDFTSTFQSRSSDSPRFDQPVDTSRAIALSLFKNESHLQKALEILPRKFAAESCILRHLHRQPADYYGALMSIPRNLRLMYVHAYQSLVWNHATSHRMRTYGSQVIEGDLILVSEHQDKNEHLVQKGRDEAPGQQTSNEATVDVDADGEIIINPSIHDRANNREDVFERARPLTAAEASSGEYNIFDVVLPLPGYDIVYPCHETGTFYKTFMAENGNLDPMNMRRKQRDFSLSGSYRKILSRIGPGWTVDVKSYTRDEEQFVQTDFEILKHERLNHTQQSSLQGRNGNDIAHNDNGAVNDETEVDATNQPQTLKQSDTFTTGENKADDAGDIGAVTAPPTVATPAAPAAPAVPAAAAANATTSLRPKIAMILKFQLGASQYATMALRELSRGGVVGYQPDFSMTGTGTGMGTGTGTGIGPRPKRKSMEDEGF